LASRRHVAAAPTSGPGPELLTIEQAAQQMSMSARYIRRLIAERRIPFHRLGRAVRINLTDINNYITSSRIEPINETTIYNHLRSAA